MMRHFCLFLFCLLSATNASGWTPLLPPTTKISASLQNIKEEYKTDEESFRAEGLGGHVSIKAPLSQNFAVGIGAGYSNQTQFDGPLDVEGEYAVRISLEAEAGLFLYRDLEGFILLNYTQDFWEFEKNLLAERSLIIELDSKILAGGVGLRYRIKKVALYSIFEKILTEDHVGSAQFTPLGGEFSYELSEKQRGKIGVEVKVSENVDIRYEQYFIGEGSWVLATDMSL